MSPLAINFVSAKFSPLQETSGAVRLRGGEGGGGLHLALDSWTTVGDLSTGGVEWQLGEVCEKEERELRFSLYLYEFEFGMKSVHIRSLLDL